MSEESEFDFIRRALRPLAQGAPNAFELTDDAAALAVDGPLADVVVTADMLVAGVHFFADDPYALVARKALRVNLSDLAAMGSTPFAYVLSTAWPPDVSKDQRDMFAHGLFEDQGAFGVSLLGGDTTTTPGPFTVSITAFGRVRNGRVVRRNAAAPGDILFVTGTIGDAGLGLCRRRGELADLADGDELLLRYQLPQPRLAAVAAVVDNASACIDVSDGLAADAGHIADCSNVKLVLRANDVPLSAPARTWLTEQNDRDAGLVKLCTSGDDYELLVAVPPANATRFRRSCEAADVRCAEIGRAEEGEGVHLLNDSGEPLRIGRAGFTHF